MRTRVDHKLSAEFYVNVRKIESLFKGCEAFLADALNKSIPPSVKIWVKRWMIICNSITKRSMGLKRRRRVVGNCCIARTTRDKGKVRGYAIAIPIP